MSNEILIGIGGLVLIVLAYFAGVWRTERRHATEDRGARIKHVFDVYMGLRRISRTAGCNGLLQSGISTLESNEEIQELLELIVNHGENHPLGSNHENVFQGVDLLKFFQYATKQQINFFSVSIEQVIRDSGQA